MKCAVFLLAALFGLCSGLQYPFSYEYDYFGSVRTGVPSRGNEYSTAAISAKLFVTVASESEAHVQIKGPQVGEYYGPIEGPNGRQRPPVQSWEPVKDAEQIQKPFTVLFSGAQEILKVPQGELLWISNLRKAVASILRVPYVMSSPPSSYVNIQENKFSAGNQTEQSFLKLEDTIHGRCHVKYTLTQANPSSPLVLETLAEDASANHMPPMERKALRQHGRRYEPKTNAPYRLVRSVELDSCSELVVTAKANSGNFSDIGRGQIRGYQSRSSFGEYLLFGTPTSEGSMRVEKAYVEGVVSMNPKLWVSPQMVAVSNQTLSLVKVTQTAVVPSPSSNLKKEPWLFRMTSPAKPGQNPPSWVSYQSQGDAYYPHVPEQDLTGFQLTSNFLSQTKKSILNLIGELASGGPSTFGSQGYNFTNASQITFKADSLASRFRALKQQQIQEIYDSVNQESGQMKENKREILLHTLAVSGAPSAIKFLQQAIQQGKISKPEAAKVFTAFEATINSPVNLKELMEYAKSLGEQEPQYLRSSVYISVSSIIRRLCIRPQHTKDERVYQYPKVTYGEQSCPMQQIQSDYIPFLQNKLKQVQKQQDKALIIQALVFLGDRKSVESVVQVAQGRQQGYEDESLRILAVLGLTKENIQPWIYSYAQKSLLVIAEEQNELQSIRKAAMFGLFTLPQNASFLQRLSMSSWREPSKEMRNFMLAMIDSRAMDRNIRHQNQSSIAKHSESLTRPSSSFDTEFEYGSWAYAGKDWQSEYALWVSKMEQSGYSQQGSVGYFSSDMIMGGIRISALKNYYAGNCGTPSLLQLLAEKSTRSRISNEVLQEFQRATAGHQQNSASSEPICIELMKTFQHMYNFTVTPQKNHIRLPLVGTIPNTGVDQKNQFTYYNPIDLTVMMPSDIGLPIITQVSTPRVTTRNISAQIESQEKLTESTDLLKSQLIKIKGQFEQETVDKVISTLKFLVPWNNRTVNVITEMSTVLFMPISYSAELDRRSSAFNKLQLNASSVQYKPVAANYTQTQFVALRDLYPESDISNASSVVSIGSTGQNGKQLQHETSLKLGEEIAGIDAVLKYRGQRRHSVKFITGVELLTSLVSVAAKMPSRPESHSVSLIIKPQTSQIKNVSLTLVHAKLHPQSQSEITSQPILETLSSRDSISERLQKLKSASAPVNSMWSANLKLHSSKVEKKYEAVYLRYGPSQKEQERQFYQVDLMSSDESKSELKKLCSGFEVRRYEQEGSNHTLIRSKSYYGDKCSRSSEMLEAQMKLNVSGIRTALTTKEREFTREEAEKLVNLEIKQKTSFSKTAEDMKEPLTRAITTWPRPSCSPIFGEVLPSTLTLNATRGNLFGAMNIHFNVSGVECRMKEVSVPSILIPILRRKVSHRLTGISQMSRMSQQCTIKPRSVQTFVGVSYEKEPVKCLSIAAANMGEENKKFIVMVKQSDEQQSKQEVKVLYPKEAIQVHLKPEGVWVNQERVSEAQKEVKSSQGEILLTISQSGNSKKVQIPGKLMAELIEGQTLNIKVSEEYKNQLVGLCGRFAEHKATDLKDSQGCFFKPQQGKIFAASWIASSEMNSCQQTQTGPVHELLQQLNSSRHQCAKTLHSFALHRQQRRQ